ncbi:hypothetical protein, variant [Verruconis gallopava]|uniref:Uncharacterized protein n=1 Tax=Verruconis gallopava TaxID=253628 RepID=A0A0D2AQN0_9PEZI|nr:hypothetical protein, variant [Verruconis gallopava]KIW08968.1 hypothetical protein, variant [Verruconis gallopava]
MSATRVESAYLNGTGASAVPDAAARSEAFYEKLLQLHEDVSNGKNPRLTFTQAPQKSQSRSSTLANISGSTHSQTEVLSRPPALDKTASSHLLSSSAAALTTAHPATRSNLTPAKTNNGPQQKTDDPTRLKIIQEARRKLERAIAEYAKAEEPILKNAREIPLNLLALAHAQVAPISGLKRDSSEDTFDEDSYYSSKANSWSTEHTEPQLGHTDNAIVISDDEEDLYEPPSQVDGNLPATGQSKISTAQHLEATNSNGEWEPDWDEEEDYEPPAPAAFGSNHPRPSPQRSTAVSATQRTSYAQLQNLPQDITSRLDLRAQMPAIAVNQIPTPAAPQPSRISPLTAGNLTRTMQSHISSIQHAHTSENMAHVGSQSESQVAESSKKRKRATPEKPLEKKGKRRAVQDQQSTPEPYIKPEPASPAPGLAAIPSRRSSVVYRAQADAGVYSSPHNTGARSAYISDQEHSPRGYRYADVDATDRVVMPPPKPIRRGIESQDLRRVASLQHARRPMSPSHDYPTYADPRAQPSRYEYFEQPVSRVPAYHESSVRPSSVRPARTPSPHAINTYDPRYSAAAPRPGQIVTDAYGNRYIAELVPEEYGAIGRRAHPEDYYGRYPSKRAEAYEDDPYSMAQPTRSRAYSTMPEPMPADRRLRAYSHIPEPTADPLVAGRAYSVHPPAPRPRETHHSDENAAYSQRRVPSRYVEGTSPHAAYTAEYPPIPRAYSTRPDASRVDMLPEYSRARAGSMVPTRHGEMAPPALPVMRPRDAAPPDDRYPSGSARGQYDDRRALGYRV